MRGGRLVLVGVFGGAVAFALACGGTTDSGWGDFAVEATGSKTIFGPGSGEISALAGTHIWVKAKSASPTPDYCKLLSDAGLIVECDYGWDVYDDEDNVMLKCGTLPANAGEILVKHLGLKQLEVWDWRNDADYGMPYCGEMDAITIEFVAP